MAVDLFWHGDRLKLQQQQLELEGSESRKGRIKQRKDRIYLYLFSYDRQQRKTIEEYISVNNRAAVDAHQQRYRRWLQVISRFAAGGGCDCERKPMSGGVGDRVIDRCFSSCETIITR